jgi:3'(2'), 5'-bisphosphate nucleotidase
MMPAMSELELATTAVAQAAQLCSAVQNQRDEVAAATKQDRSPVTVADYGAQALICRLLAEHFPDDRVLAEEHSADLLAEGGSELSAALVAAVSKTLGTSASLEEICGWIEHGRGCDSSRSWILDPVDGTKGFLRGGQYAIALALLEGEQLSLGVLGCPNLALGDGLGCLLYARRGRGAFQAPLSDTSKREDISVAAAGSPSELVFVESVESAHADHGAHAKICELLGAKREPLRMDSQAKYAAVARGDASVYLRLPNPKTPEYRQKAWDHAAGALLVTEAGGRVTDIFGQQLDFTAGPTLANNRGVVATSGHCHHAVIQAVTATQKPNT